MYYASSYHSLDLAHKITLYVACARYKEIPIVNKSMVRIALLAHV